ncbi:hypothetical protein BJF78_20830 [Pseudonocardia sp. CNS-139]|nr:hypothetical protein BJF78_20830 [Pseudonocardia sp. CNS-139]
MAAADRFAAVDGGYELTLGGYVPRARVFLAQCGGYLAAAGESERGGHDVAFQRYREARAVAPDTPLAPFLHDGIVRAATARATDERANGDRAEAVRWYREVLTEQAGDRAAVAAVREEIAATYFEQADAERQEVLGPAGGGNVQAAGTALLSIADELGDTPTAQRVPQGFADLYAAASSGIPAGRFCDALPLLDEYLGLREQAIAAILPRAHGDRAEALLRCGIQRFDADDYLPAADAFRRLVTTYPDAPQTPQARSALIAARVGEGRYRGAVELPVPYAGDSPGNNPVTFYNATPYELHVMVAGPTAHELTLRRARAARPSPRTATRPARPSTGGRPRRCGCAPATTTSSASSRRTRRWTR